MTGFGHVTEQAAFDRVELRTIRGIVGHTDRDGKVVDDRLEVFLEQMLVATVTATTIAQEQDGGRVGVQTPSIAVPKQPQAIAGECGRVTAEAHMNPALITGQIVDTMRNDDATGQAGEIMIKRFERLLAVDLAITVERAQEFLLLGIDAQDGVARLEKLLDEMGQMTKLRVAMRRVAAGQDLGHLATGQTKRVENASHDAGSSTDALCLQPVGNLLGGQIRPHNVLVHGITSGAVLDGVVHLLDQVRLFDFGLFASASWLADAAARRIIRQLLEFLHTVFDGLRVASKDLRHVPDAAMSELDRFECGKASAVL